jgi:hypothetical protein
VTTQPSQPPSADLVTDDRPKSLPALAIEAHHLHFLDRIVLVPTCIHGDARQKHSRFHVAANLRGRSSNLSRGSSALTGSADIKLNERCSLRRRQDRIHYHTETFPGPTIAKPSVEHFPAMVLFGDRLRFHD